MLLSGELYSHILLELEIAINDLKIEIDNPIQVDTVVEFVLHNLVCKINFNV